jgi:hypothetical protein
MEKSIHPEFNQRQYYLNKLLWRWLFARTAYRLTVMKPTPDEGDVDPRSALMPMSLTPYLPEWIGAARRAALGLRATTAHVRGAGHSLYVILLKDNRRMGRWGLYVGETSRDPDLRFDQHMSGYKASGAVRRFGVRLLPELTSHLNPLRRWEAVELEPALAEAFSAAGVPWVEGGH